MFSYIREKKNLRSDADVLRLCIGEAYFSVVMREEWATEGKLSIEERRKLSVPKFMR